MDIKSNQSNIEQSKDILLIVNRFLVVLFVSLGILLGMAVVYSGLNGYKYSPIIAMIGCFLIFTLADRTFVWANKRFKNK